MRVVVACVPQTGHIVPLLPLAEALAAQGDDVLVASGVDAEPMVTGRRLRFRLAGPTFAEWYGALLARTRGQPGAGLPPDRVERYFLPRLFGEVGAALMLDGLLAAVREHRAEVVVFDPLVFAAPLVAEVCRARPVLHTIGPLPAREATDLVADAVSPMWREFGLEVPPHAGIYAGPALAICPPSLDPASAALADVRPLRPTSLPAPAAPPEGPPPHVWERPVIYVTLGTFSNSNLAMFRLLLEALADQPVSVIATIGRDNDPAALAPVPANAFVTRFVPQARLLPHCAAVVHHAGAGTAFGVLSHGLPSVAVPQSADNFTIAERLDGAGVARVLMPDDVSVEAVREAALAVLADDGYRQAACGLADEIAAMPSPQEVAAALRA